MQGNYVSHCQASELRFDHGYSRDAEEKKNKVICVLESHGAGLGKPCTVVDPLKEWQMAQGS